MESLVVALIVAAAALYVGRRLYRTVAGARRAKGGACGAGCGCGESGHPEGR